MAETIEVASSLDGGDLSTGPGAELAAAIVELGPDGILLVDGDGRIHFANRRAAGLFGHPRHVLAHLGLEDLIPSTAAATGSRGPAGPATPTPHLMGADPEQRALRSDGTEIPVLVSTSPASVAGRLFTIVAIREASELRVSEAATRLAFLAEEEQRIGADLHSRVIRNLFEAGMCVQSVMALADRPLALRLELAVSQIDLAIGEIRNTVFDRTRR